MLCFRFIKRRNDGGDSREGLSSLFVCCSGRSEPPRECNGVTTTTSLDVPDNDQARSANGEHLTINNEQVKVNIAGTPSHDKRTSQSYAG